MKSRCGLSQLPLVRHGARRGHDAKGERGDCGGAGEPLGNAIADEATTFERRAGTQGTESES
jgi:hypothetical protein